ncbi:hypothetical protein JAAARDRAFT_37259 [Jaapia argillacea MUCL 33604]|uniref:Gluconokinase n=1 Tax=Jaapia argillacea MUCL 33604 TaxID=933084 RepID=A0A067PZR5_9AGAM|nr:hypothetical protein JAAARDRAFT_37259 [Jaapia argillacea MUCL 33604]
MVKEVELDAKAQKPVLIVVMGVCGTGKSTLGGALAEALSMPLIEGDEMHTKAAVAKMASGQPLTDIDREPWLQLIRTTAEHMSVEQSHDPSKSVDIRRGVIVTCSALKRYYRDILRGTYVPPNGVPNHLEPPELDRLPTYFVYIKGERQLLLDRMEKRKGHYMKASMLDSQLAILESPEGEDGVVVVSSEDSTEEQMHMALGELKTLAGIV